MRKTSFAATELNCPSKVTSDRCVCGTVTCSEIMVSESERIRRGD